MYNKFSNHYTNGRRYTMGTSSHESYIRIVDGADTAVLMVHGIMSTPRHFDFILPYIPAHFSVCNILLDGHGGTVSDFSKTSMKKWRAQVLHHLTKLSQTHQKILVIGYSMGTLLTLELVERFPQIKAMVLLNTPLKVFVKPVMSMRSLKFSFGKVNTENPVELATYNDIGIKLTPYLWQYIPTIPRFLELLKLCRDTRPKAKSLSIPAHAYFGKKDELVSVKSALYFAYNKNVMVQVFDCTGHCYYEDTFKTAVIKSVRCFVDTLDKAKNT
ncbi:MAG: alpha/beta fold hydrolase [Ruminococcaceae bacterium]|nr:alpha/beta fold hydrolase [Oscillospiraceae bacterium]